MKITFITGLPGAGKSTYAESTGCPVTYDLDRIADALDYKRGTLIARMAAGELMPAIINAAERKDISRIQLIRVTPSTEEMCLAKRHQCEVIEIERDLERCAECRPDITKDEWNSIILRHEIFLKSNKHRTVKTPEERW